MNDSKTLVEKITEGIQEKKGKKIVVADLTDIDDTICNYFVVCQGESPNQVAAITDSVKDYVREETGYKPITIDGLKNTQWVAMDYSDVLVHIFLPDVREFYNLENLWADAKLISIPDID
ncbi:MAG: ribosome silencing factor [Bacteroidaceae bacterium]|nr:ribosome silencing factor [Bacteroidaceae bacterium]